MTTAAAPPMLPADAMTHPLFPAASLFPLSEVGGVVFGMPNDKPGTLRAFSATLGVVMPQLAKKHDTSTTSPATSTPTQVSDDGRVRSDNQADRGSDS